MVDKIALSVTPEEYRSLIMARIDQCLAENGVDLPATIRAQITEYIPMPASRVPVESDSGKARSVPATVPHEAKRLLDAAQRRAIKSDTDKRARAYRPTSRAKAVSHPSSIADRVLNQIVGSGLCTLPDLVSSTKKPPKAIYNALWQLKSKKLIDISPLAAVEPESTEHN